MTETLLQRDAQLQAIQGRGCLFYVKRALKWAAGSALALIVLGFAYQTVATEMDRRSYLPPGQLVNVNGHEMHILCMGEGSPTVILDAGAAALWAWIQPAVGQFTRVCAYDRAGYGWSAPGPEPRSAGYVAGELHALLEMAGIQPPYIIAAHSFGGIYARVFYGQYPGEVAGIALLDATHPDNWERQGESPEALRAMSSVAAVLSRVGLMRLVAAGQDFALPEAENAALKASMASSRYWDSQRADAAALEASLDAARAVGSLGDLPLAVVAALTYPEGQGRDTERALQLELAALSENSSYQEIAGAGHITLLTDERYARFVSEAIRRVIEAVRTGRSLAG